MYTVYLYIYTFEKVSHSSQSRAQNAFNLSLLAGGGHAIMLGANAENRATVARFKTAHSVMGATRSRPVRWVETLVDGTIDICYKFLWVKQCHFYHKNDWEWFIPFIYKNGDLRDGLLFYLH